MTPPWIDGLGRSSDQLLPFLRLDEPGDRALAGLDDDGWRRLTEDAAAFNLLGILGRRVQRAGLRVKMPVQSRNLVRSAVLATATRKLQAMAAVGACVVKADRPVMLLKGSDLAQRYWGNIGQRTMLDIDILVHRQDLPMIDAALREGGFRAGAALEMADLPGEHHIVYAAPAGGLAVEVHWRLSRHVADGIDLDELWGRSLSAQLGEAPARCMAPSDLLPYLSSHLAHHLYWTSLNQIWDMAEVLMAEGPLLDWAASWEAARRWKLENSMALALELMRSILAPPVAVTNCGVSVPAALVDAARGEIDRHVRGLPPTLGEGRLLDIMVGTEPPVAKAVHFLRAAFPSPSALAAKQGLTGNPAALARGYVRHWRHLASTRGPALWRWLIRDRDFDHVRRRAAAMRHWVESG